MDWGKINKDEDVALSSPLSKMFLNPQVEQIIHCAMGLRHPIDVDALKKAFLDSAMIQHPRFCSLVVRDRGREYWRKTRVNIENHFIVIDSSSHVEDDDVEASVNAYLADLAVSNRLSENKPLWEVHVLLGLNCVVLRVHHSICDGASLMSMLSACFGKQKSLKDDLKERENGKEMKKTSQGTRKLRLGGMLGWVKSIWFTLVFFGKDLGKMLCMKDKSVIYGGEGVELWPRKVETIKCELQDLKSIKKAIPNATVNDALLGIVSLGLSKYLYMKSPGALHHGLEVTAIVPVNLRKTSGLQELPELMKSSSWWCGLTSWGNKTGLVLQPIHCYNELRPLEHVKRMKAIMDRKKQSYEPHMFYIGPQLALSCWGRKVLNYLTYKTTCNTTLTVSNIVGPSEEIAIARNPTTYMRVTISSLPQALVVYMVSYAGKVDLQVMVAKDIIPESQLLVECFEESVREMKRCADGNDK